MPSILSLSVAAFVCGAVAVAVAAAPLPSGAPVSRAASYARDPFTCLDGSASLPHSSLNDNYCDCVDGSDEPGTSACAGGSFWCANKGARGKWVPSSLVMDGVCDCCDGGDEGGKPGTCKDTCEADGAAWRAAQAAAIQVAEAGALKRLEYEALGTSASILRLGVQAKQSAEVAKALAAKEAAATVSVCGGCDCARLAGGARQSRTPHPHTHPFSRRWWRLKRTRLPRRWRRLRRQRGHPPPSPPSCQRWRWRPAWG